MPTSEDWRGLVEHCKRTFLVSAHSYRGVRFRSFAAPVVLGCDDGEDYVVKSVTKPNLKRAICNDQIMGHLAAALLAPVPTVKIVNIPQALIDEEPALVGIPAGPAHGSRYVPNASKTRQGIQHQNLPHNRSRFALLAVMYGLAGVFQDHQFFYEDGANLVWSFDHGHFFHRGPNWTIESLRESPAARPDATISDQCKFDDAELFAALERLVHLSNTAIAAAVASPMDEWHLSTDERVALAEHLLARRNTLSQ